MNPLKVEELYKSWGKELEIELIAGKKGLSRKISSDRIQKAGLKLLDPDLKLEEGTIQILGNTEIAYFDRLRKIEKEKVTKILSSQDVPCFIISKELNPDEAFMASCNRMDIPIFSTKLYTGKLFSLLQEILEVRLAPFATAHGVLM
ncbi:MAG: hypothetical protein ACHQ6U_12955, partial [Thermodesulfobacteriota bacterium]